MVTDIAARAGVTARTFFRHFGDKRKVLFDGASEMERRSPAALQAAPAAAPALAAVTLALDAAAGVIDGDRSWVQKRQAVIRANPELQERELIKLAPMSAGLAGALRRRGADAVEASLAAEAGTAVYRVAFDQWVDAEQDGSLRDVVHEVLACLRPLAAGAPGVSAPGAVLG